MTRLGHKLLSFTGIGSIATIVQYVVLVLLVSVFHWPAVLSSTIGFGLSALLNYILNYNFTFKSSSPHLTALTRFFFMVLVGLGLNALVMHLMTAWLGFHYLLAQVLTTGLVFIWNFTVSQLWTFRAPT
jgi:putative flippase GtrA